jgi:lycopene cyclase domain-containing protein
VIEYTLAAVAAMTATISVAALQGLLSRPAYWYGLAGFVALTVISDSALVANGVFTFGGRFISGIRIGPMPVEDLLYGAALYSLAVTAHEWSAKGRRKLSELFRASRPFSWINTALPCLACGIAVGRPTAALVAGTIYFLAPYNLLLYGANDAFDYESDRRNPRKKGALEGGLVPPHRRVVLWSAIALTNIPLLALLAWLGGPLTSAALAATVAVALIYSVPPLRTKELPGLDALTSSLHFVLPCACGALLAGASIGAMPWRYLAAFLLWGAASQALGAIQDIEFDRRAGIGSIAVSFGPRLTATLSMLLYSAAAALVASAGGLAVAAAVVLLPYPLLAASCLAGDSHLQARRAWKGFLGMNLLSGFVITQVLLRAWGVGRVTVLEMLAWGSAAGVLALLFLFATNRLRMRRTAGPGGAEGVTVIVPVRDEEVRIAACLQTLPRAADVIVVDDGSRDRTTAVATAMMGPRGSVVSAGDRPSGWTGKCWAAWRGAELATGDVLVFLDADTQITDTALGWAASEVTLRGGLVSFLTRYDMPTPAERALMPAFALMQVALWPQGLLPLAYGPFMVARRTEYMELGGHQSIAGSDREDVDLARLFAAAGRSVRLFHGADLGVTRHYASARQVCDAWRRMYYAYSGFSLAVALAGLLGLATVFLVPGLAFIVAWFTSDGPALLGACAGLVVLLALRSAVAISERQPLSTIAWHPVTWIATLAAMCLSVADGLRGRRPVWRGTELAGRTR